MRDASTNPNEPPVPRAPSPDAVTRPGLALGRMFDVEVRADWSLLIIFMLIVVDLAYGTLPHWHPEWGSPLRWGVAVAAASLFFASVLLHELSHAVVGRAQGVQVRRITLFLFGGLAEMENEPPSAKAELLMAAVGPLTSLVIGLLASWSGAQIAGASRVQDVETAMHVVRNAGPLATLLLWLGPVNLLLALFNMIPGFPLDGGRVLRAVIWWSTGSLTRATRLASGIGRGFAWLLMGFGVVQLLSGAAAQGLWYILIGWFLNSAAVMSYQRTLLSQALGDISVARVMRTHVESISPDTTIEELVREHMIPREQAGFPVVSSGAELLGIVTREDIRRLPHADWPTTHVVSVMTPARELATLPPEAGAERALQELAARRVGQIPVVDHGHLLGMVVRRDLLEWAALHEPAHAP